MKNVPSVPNVQFDSIQLIMLYSASRACNSQLVLELLFPVNNGISCVGLEYISSQNRIGLILPIWIWMLKLNNISRLFVFEI